MATKSDLIEAQNFSRRRLLTAFVSGAPGGKELEPAAPMRAVIAAIALTALVVLVGVFYGFIRPGLPQGWENGKLVLVSDTGARFVTVDGVLHPVINTASARLLLPSEGFSVISTDQQNLAGTEIGETLGILGAPDELPPRSALSNAGWSACVVDDESIDVRVGATGGPREAAGLAAVVSSGGILYVIAGDRSFAVGSADPDAVLRAAGVTSLDPTPVSADWLNLFTPGSALTPIILPDAGAPVPGADLRVGDVVRVTGTPETDRLLVQSDGTLAALSPLAWQLYQLGSGSGQGSEVTEVSASAIAGLATASRPAGGEDWPSEAFPSIDPDQRPCATLVAQEGQAATALATQDADIEVTPGVSVRPGTGALVLAGGRGEQNTALLTIVDATGTAFALPGATDETVARLGYEPDDIGAVPDGWTALLPSGPALSEEAAGRSPAGAP